MSKFKFQRKSKLNRLMKSRHSGENRSPDVVPAKAGSHVKYWIPISIGNPGFRLEFIPMKIGAGMTVKGIFDIQSFVIDLTFGF